MTSHRTTLSAAAAVLAAVLAAPPAADAALARKLGQPARYTGRLSSNPAIRKQQLIVDPDGIAGGSVTTSYDPAIVRLSGLVDTGDFEITGGFVDVVGRPNSAVIRVPIDAFLNPTARAAAGIAAAGNPEPQEAGSVQLFFARRPAAAAATPFAGAAANDASTIPNLPGYVTVDQDGPTGVGDTHAVTFDFVAADPRTVATYTIFAAEGIGSLSGGDTLIPADDPENPIPFDQIGSATVRGPLQPAYGVTLPAGAAAGGLGLAAAAGAAAVAGRRRRRPQMW